MFRALSGAVAGTFLAGVVLVGVLDGQQPQSTSPARDLKNPVPSSAKSVETGRKLFKQYCRPCHGEDAKGNGPMAPKDIHPPNLTDAVWGYGSTDGEIFTNIRNGIGPKFNMKSWKSKMTEDQIWSVVNYLRSLGAK
jgi:cbb3-type cytochrome c oxidase subunit III